MTTQTYLSENIISQLMDYQISKVNRIIRDFLDANKEANEFHFDVCPKCGQKHPRLVKGGFANSGKQMFRCLECNKRFVVDHGQLTYYSHQSQDKWNDLIIDTIAGKSLLSTAAKLDVDEKTVFRMRHKFLKFLEEEQGPICIIRSN